MKQSIFFIMKWISKMNANSPWGNNSKGNGSSSNNDSYNDDYLSTIQKKLKDMFPKNNPFNLYIILVILLALWTLSGFYRVGTDEQGVVTRFGEYVRTTEPGLHYHLPIP